MRTRRSVVVLFGLLLAVSLSACTTGTTGTKNGSVSLPPIAVVSGTNDVYLLYNNGTPHYVTTGQSVSWTPDHDELLVEVANFNRNPPSSEIWLVTPYGNLVRQVTSVYPDQVRFFAAGQYGSIPFLAYDTDKSGIQLSNLLTGAQRTIRVGAPVDSLAISPDGGRIAFTPDQNQDSLPLTLYVTGTYKKTPLKEVLPASKYRDINDPSWSPDGQWIAATITTFKGAGVSVNAVWLMRPDGTGLHMLTAGLSPQWSPDGQWISYISESRDGLALFRIHLNGTDRTQLTPYTEGSSATAAVSQQSW